MPEALPTFVARRRPDWDALSELVVRQRKGGLHLDDLVTLDRLHRRAVTDLAYAQAHYAQTDALRFLNRLCASTYGAIYRPVKDRPTALRRYFAAEFPRALRAELGYVGLSAGLLLLGAALGVLLVLANPGAAGLIVPQHLLDAIAERRMWTDDIVSVAPNAVSSGIATNNLTVTIIAFALGITGGLGTAYVMVSNGVLLGAVAALCLQAGMGYPFFSFVGGHGVVELSVIAIAGGAGLIVGHALIDPGELPRAEHLRRRSVDAVKLVLGCAPFLALIAVIEGYVSPGDFFPGWLKIALGLTLGACFWGYLLFAGSSAPPTPTGAKASIRRRSR